MVSDYECTACGIRFSVGTFHYHIFEDGYAGKCLMVCKSCGGPHSIEIALSSSGEEYNNVCEVVVNDYTDRGRKFLLVELRKHNKRSISEALSLVNDTPFTLYREMTEKGANQSVNRLHNSGVFAEARVYEQRKNPFYSLDKRDRYLCKESVASDHWVEIQVRDSSYVGQRLIVETLVCSKCESLGQLTSNWDETDDNCPSCKMPKLILTGNWLT